MKKFFTICLLFSTLFLYSQEQFNYTYEQYTIPNGENIFALNDTGYTLVGAVMLNSKIYISVLFSDIEGIYTGEKLYGDDSPYHYRGGAENSCIKIDGGYVLAGSAQLASQDTCMIYIVKFDEQFDTIWTKKYFLDTNWVVARGICNTDDGGYMVVGETELNSDSVWSSNYPKGLMLKLDSEGNYQWFNSFGTDEYSDYFYKVVQTHDGGYLVGGATCSWQEPLWYPDLGDWYVVKTDSGGNEEWSRQYGNPDLDDGRVMDILKASDSTYYISGAWTYDRNNTGSVKNDESYIVKLDKNFNEIYELKYDEPNYFDALAGDMIELEDENIVVLGYRLMGQGIAYEMRTTIHKITPSGEVLWERQYVADNDTNTTASYGMSVKQTADGGFVFGGWAYGPGMSPSQQMWLVKTDSLGCDGTGDFWDCSTGVMVNEYVSNESFEMYPNPASESLTLNIPVQTGIHNQTVEIYNLTGKLVKSFPLDTERSRSVGETEKGLNISDLQSGIYIVKVGEQMQKLVVE